MNPKIEKLDSYVLKTLDTLSEWKYPEIDIPKSDYNVFMGSGSGACIAELFTKKFGGIFLKAHDYKDFLQRGIEKSWKSINIVSASGGKDAVNMAKLCKDMGYDVNLITCNPNPPCKELVKKIFLFPSFSDPPTYNVSTYFSMVHWLFNEDIQEIKIFLSQIKKINLRKYKYIFFVSDDKFASIAQMGYRKIGESLQGLGANGEGSSQAAHGVILQPNKNRLVIRLNCDFPVSGNVTDIKINSYLGLLSAVYYIIGQNQKDSDIKNTLDQYAKTVKHNNWQLSERQ
ncbi:MAG TPA: hypothetical protein PKX30_01075 [Candidatus Pacearchaeota archaeon]|nr:hypothetical protein [Candidatus Pacearchaeota archaeon]